MNNQFVEGLVDNQNLTLTENMALTHESSLSYLLDFYALGGALRTRSEEDIIQLFSKAFAEDRTLALKCLFYFRDIRQGQGERRTFRTILTWLANNQPNSISDLILLIPEYGRWDDLYSLIATPLESDMWEGIKWQLIADLANAEAEENISLLSKWLKSENTSSKESCRLGTLTRKALGLNSKNYREILSSLRTYIDITEKKMSENNWDEITYSTVPSKAMKNYSKAFSRHDNLRFSRYLKKVVKGEEKINSSTLYPYDVVKPILDISFSIFHCNSLNLKLDPNEVLRIEAQWQAMPNWLEGHEDQYGIVVADTSGSMEGLPIAISTSLALYFAERNTGPFQDMFITFSSKPKLQRIVGNNITEKIINLLKADWNMNTDIDAVFNLILSTAVENKVEQKDLPSTIYIISDMEFDRCIEDKTNYQNAKDKFTQAGYNLPTIVFWNVDARHNHLPTTIKNNAILVSGASPSIFKFLMSGKTNPIDVMLETLNSERYESIK